MPENKNQNINPNISSSSQSTASGSGTSNQNIASSLDKKLELFIEKRKKNFDSFQISQVNYETAKNEIKEKLLELHERKDCEAEIDLVVDRNSVFREFMESKEESRKKRKAKAEKVAEAIGKTVMGIV